MIRITYNQGNGYRCSCCRRTSTEFVDFTTEQEAIQWLSELEADKQIPSYEDAGDRYVKEIREFKDEEIVLSADPAMVEKFIEQRKRKKEKEEQSEERAQKAEELRTLRQLKRKYPQA